MKMSDIKLLSEKDFTKKIREANEESVELRLQAVSNELKDFSKIKKNRKHIARLLTAQQANKGENSGK